MEFCTPPALKRKFEEADARADESALVRVFLDEVALLEKLRCAAAKLVKKRPKTWLQHPVNKAKVTAAHSPVDETLDRIAALSASIPHPSSLTPPVQDHQWQADDTERRRQRLARNLKGTGSGPTPCISAHRALQQLSSVPNPSGVNQNRTPKETTRYNCPWRAPIELHMCPQCAPNELQMCLDCASKVLPRCPSADSIIHTDIPAWSVVNVVVIIEVANHRFAMVNQVAYLFMGTVLCWESQRQDCTTKSIA